MIEPQTQPLGNLNIAHFWNGTTGKIAITPRELRIATLTNNQTCGARRALQVSILHRVAIRDSRGVIAIFPVVPFKK